MPYPGSGGELAGGLKQRPGKTSRQAVLTQKERPDTVVREVRPSKEAKDLLSYDQRNGWKSGFKKMICSAVAGTSIEVRFSKCGCVARLRVPKEICSDLFGWCKQKGLEVYHPSESLMKYRN